MCWTKLWSETLENVQMKRFEVEVVPSRYTKTEPILYKSDSSRRSLKSILSYCFWCFTSSNNASLKGTSLFSHSIHFSTSSMRIASGSLMHLNCCMELRLFFSHNYGLIIPYVWLTQDEMDVPNDSTSTKMTHPFVLRLDPLLTASKHCLRTNFFDVRLHLYRVGNGRLKTNVLKKNFTELLEPFRWLSIVSAEEFQSAIRQLDWGDFKTGLRQITSQTNRDAKMALISGTVTSRELTDEQRVTDESASLS